MEHAGLIVLIVISVVVASYISASYLPIITKARAPSITFEDLRELHFLANRFEATTLPAPAEVMSVRTFLTVAEAPLEASRVVLAWRCSAPSVNLTGTWTLKGNRTHVELVSGAYVQDLGNVLIVRYWSEGADRIYSLSWEEETRVFSAVLTGPITLAGEELAVVRGWREVRVVEGVVKG